MFFGQTQHLYILLIFFQILMPLPVPEDTSENPLLWQNAGERYGEPGTIAVVPMAELQDMLVAGMPNTQTLITKLSSQATSRQTLKELMPSCPAPRL